MAIPTNAELIKAHGAQGMDPAVCLKTGFHRFRETIYNKNLKLFESLKAVQSPRTGHCNIGSAIEFAVVVLKVKCIVVIGHNHCARIRELFSLKEQGPHAFQFIGDWVKIVLDAKRKVQRENRLLPFDSQCTLLEKI